MSEALIKEGELLFNARGVPVAIVRRIDGDEIRASRRGRMVLPACEIDLLAEPGKAKVVETMGDLVILETGEEK